MKPMPEHIGVGITAMTSLECLGSFKHESIGIYHNYFVTETAWDWPRKPKPSNIVLDGFSPNLNKELHIGHLKNLVIASALTNITSASPVAMLGAANGINNGAMEAYKKWCNLANYHPKIYLDIELPAPSENLYDGVSEYAGCKMFNNVVIYKSTGASTYAAHDLSFAKLVAPDFYLTGQEQKEHFSNLGLGTKHLPMGLVLGKDGSKMKSTIKKDGDIANGITAQELIDEISKIIKPTPDPMALIWNVLAWQFNSASVSKNTILDIENWCKITSPGIYISYTFAKIQKALSFAKIMGDKNQLSLDDAKLCGFASYFHYYLNKAIENNEPYYIAQFALSLSKKLSEIYDKKSIKDGTASFIFSVNYSLDILKQCMILLGMNVLKEI